MTTATRSEALPDVPSVGEVVPGYETSGWTGVGVPKGTPVDIVDALNREVNAGLADTKIKGRLAHLGETVFAGSRSEFETFVAAETEKFGKVIKFAGINPE